MSPNGKIVWHGHPSGLSGSLIEEHIKDVRMRPTFELSKALKKAKKLLNSGKYAKGINSLQKVIEKEEDEGLVNEAVAAIAKVNRYGENQLKKIDLYAKEGYFAIAMKTLKRLDSSFKGTDIGDRAKTKLAAWKKDKKIKAEISGAKIIEVADGLMNKGRYRNAAKLLMKVTRGKKYEGTMAQESAREKLEGLSSKL